MLTDDQKKLLLQEARSLSERLAGDIPLALSRAEHIRLTARALEANQLASALEVLLDSETDNG